MFITLKPAITAALVFVSGWAFARGPALDFAEAAELAVHACSELRAEKAMHALREQSWVLGFRAYLPQLRFSASEDDRLSRLGTDSFNKTYTLSLIQLLWDGGRTRQSRQLDKAGLKFEESELYRMTDTLVEEVLSIYRAILMQRSVLAIKETSLALLVEQKMIMDEELKNGLVLANDIREAEIQVAELHIEIERMKLDLTGIEKQLAFLLDCEQVPELSEHIDIYRSTQLPAAGAAVSMALQNNSELRSLRFSVQKSQTEARAASRSWFPLIHGTGEVILSGRNYPLNHYSWNVGLIIEFSSPLIKSSFSGNAGWEPPYDRSARIKNDNEVLPDPAAALGYRSAALAAELEQQKLSSAIKDIKSQTENAVELCMLADRKRELCLKALDLGRIKKELAEVYLDLGQITRLEFMQSCLEFSQKEINAVEAAVELQQTEQNLERIMGLSPSGLEAFAASLTSPGE